MITYIYVYMCNIINGTMVGLGYKSYRTHQKVVVLIPSPLAMVRYFEGKGWNEAQGSNTDRPAVRQCRL